MKKRNILLKGILSILLSHNLNIQGQSTTLGHFVIAPPAINWCGWDAATAIPFHLEHRGTQNINFLTGNVFRMTIRGTATGTAQGFVGIGGTFSVVGTDPQSLLHIHDGSNSYLQVTNGGTGPPLTSTVGVKFGLLNNTIHAVIAQQSTNAFSRMYFTTNGAPAAANAKMTITNNGSVGIGNGYNNPNTLLDVNGGDIDVNTPQRSYMIGDQSVLWHKGSTTNIFVGVGAGNNHGLNFNSDNTYVGAQAGFSGSGLPATPIQNARNTLIGAAAGYSNNATGAVFVGYRAGYNFDQNGGSTGNTFVGYESGFFTNQGRNDNAFFGSNSGHNNTTGDQNSFFGNNCGFNSTTGVHNCFFGNAAGTANTIHFNNNYYGHSAGGISNGDENIVIGTAAGTSGVGDKNVVVGNAGMFLANSGNENVALGFETLLNGTNNNFNVIMGSQSTPTLTGSNLNTMIGYKTAFTQTIGVSNAYLGESTGNNVKGGSNNTFIGAKADVTTANSTTVTNATAIGANAKVTNANHMILGANNVNVGIGLSSDATGPQNKLEINTGSPGTSGLRFRQLTASSPTVVNTGSGVLALNSTGDVIYVPDQAGSGGITAAQNGLSLVGTNTVELGGTLLHNTHIDMKGSMLTFSNSISPTYTNYIHVRGPEGGTFSSATGPAPFGTPEANFYEEAIAIGTSNTNYGRKLIVVPQTSAVSPVGNRLIGSYSEVNTNSVGIGGHTIGSWSQARNTGTGKNTANYNLATGAASGQDNIAVFADANGGSDNYGVQVVLNNNLTSANIDVGIYAQSNSNLTTVTSIGGDFNSINGFNAFGVRASAQGGDITNYGVYTKVPAGPTGSSNYGIWAEAPIPGSTTTVSYAGYFKGDVYFNGNIDGSGTFNYVSDAMFKTNIDTITNAQNIIKQLKPKTFYYDTTNTSNIAFSNKKQYGLIAQDVETILPELVNVSNKPAERDTLGNVTTPGISYKSLNYNAFIAILIKGMQQQQRTIEKQDSVMQNMQSQISALTSSVTSCCSSSAIRSTTPYEQNQLTVNLSDKDIIVLNQNVPNPFAEQTTITYNVPEKYGYAQMIFSTIEGRILKTVDITKKGKGSVTVYSNDLSSGMYTYSLIVDGKTFDTKKMVKSE